MVSPEKQRAVLRQRGLIGASAHQNPIGWEAMTLGSPTGSDDEGVALEPRGPPRDRSRGARWHVSGGGSERTATTTTSRSSMSSHSVSSGAGNDLLERDSFEVGSSTSSPARLARMGHKPGSPMTTPLGSPTGSDDEAPLEARDPFSRAMRRAMRCSADAAGDSNGDEDPDESSDWLGAVAEFEILSPKSLARLARMGHKPGSPMTTPLGSPTASDDEAPLEPRDPFSRAMRRAMRRSADLAAGDSDGDDDPDESGDRLGVVAEFGSLSPESLARLGYKPGSPMTTPLGSPTASDDEAPLEPRDPFSRAMRRAMRRSADLAAGDGDGDGDPDESSDRLGAVAEFGSLSPKSLARLGLKPVSPMTTPLGSPTASDDEAPLEPRDRDTTAPNEEEDEEEEDDEDDGEDGDVSWADDDDASSAALGSLDLDRLSIGGSGGRRIPPSRAEHHRVGDCGGGAIARPPSIVRHPASHYHALPPAPPQRRRERGLGCGLLQLALCPLPPRYEIY